MRLMVEERNGGRKKTWKEQICEESVKVGLSRKYVLCRLKWIVGVNKIITRLRCPGHPHLVRILLHVLHVSPSIDDLPNITSY